MVEEPAEADYDVIVVGAGAGGMSAALSAAIRGLSVLVVEKTEYFGGTTAYSAGAIWIPNNSHLHRAGAEDSFEKARDYLAATVGDGVPDKLREAYLLQGPWMVDEFDHKTSSVRWEYVDGYPDYYPEAPGGTLRGRALESEPVDVRKLGAERGRLRPPTAVRRPKGIVLRTSDVQGLYNMARTTRGKMTLLRVLIRLLKYRLRGAQYLAMGQAMSTRLRLGLGEFDVPVWYSTPLIDLVSEKTSEGSKITGVRVVRDGTELTLRARRGVVLASGSFSRSGELRDKYLTAPTSSDWSLTHDADTGDSIAIGLRHGAALDLMDKVWGMPSVLIPQPKGRPRAGMLIAERQQPGSIIVNQNGERFTNEAVPYAECRDQIYANDKPGASTIPSWLVFDGRSKRRSVMLNVLPHQGFPRVWFENGFMKRANTIAELAEQMGVPADTLTSTVERFNGFAHSGRDDDFGRGDSAYDRYYGDPTLTNPGLGPLAKAPYYAVQVWPADIGTKGGLVIDENARVLDVDRRPIRGLFATGNCSASVMGAVYPGPGASLGPAMVFGFIAGKYAAESAPVIV
ncbi:FAD-dependent oxidoreductase [Nocardia neocaledoniensis]|uniref:FAD-dependent oxidoreductase n=1 Tax=Nocardia neocaledoniensis TaxID=236511 RepID=UPI0024587A96|nr:FAD-dependent oxidoreductase [Nocardia neocaledoniensis]